MTACFALGANCQSKIDWKEEYRQAVSVIARLKKDSSSLSQLVEDTARLKRTIAFKDRAFQMLTEQMMFNRQRADTLASIRNQQADIIATLDKAVRSKDEQIGKLSKPKNWCFGPVAGYGVAGQSFGAFIGVGVSWGVRF